MEHQSEEDLKYSSFSPSFFNDLELVFWPELGPRLVRIDKLLSQRHYSVIYTLVGIKSVVIKYEVSCWGNDDTIHGLIREFWFMRRLSILNITPNPIFLSPPTKFENYHSSKLDFTISGQERRN